MKAHVGIGVSPLGLLLLTTVLLVLVLLRSGDEAKYCGLRLRVDPGEGGLGVVVVLWNMCFFMDMSIEITPTDRTQRFFTAIDSSSIASSVPKVTSSRSPDHA